jgi:hypothetical protein
VHGSAPTPNVAFEYAEAYNRLKTMTDGTGEPKYFFHPGGVLGAGKLASVDGPLADDVVAMA